MADMHSIAEKMRLSEPTTKTWMKIDLYYRRQKCNDSSFWQCKIYADIRKGSLERASNDSGVIENVDFQGFWTLRLRHLRKWGQHYYIVLFSPLSPFHWPQNIWPWVTLTGYFALKFCFRTGLAGWHRATSENNCVKTNKDRQILSALESSVGV